MRSNPAGAALLAALLNLAACEGPQSALSPAGRHADRVAELFSWMAGGALVIWALVMGIAVYAVARRRAHGERAARLFILGGGVVFPTVVLTALLIYGLSMMPGLLPEEPARGLRVRVTGEQWWWRVRYDLDDGRSVELANELRLPLGRTASLRLDSPDVIHALWIPSLAGKVDLIPGRVTRLSLEPTRAGVFRGTCAEFCGESHTWMSLYAVVEEPTELAAWLAHQLEPAREPVGADAQRGAALFLANGCGACHTVRGTPAAGRVGPDLTHVGSRLSLAAGALDNERADFRRWVAHPEAFKPAVHMPAFGMLAARDLAALAAYLEGLE